MVFVLLALSILLAIAGQYLLKTGVTAIPPDASIAGVLRTLFSVPILGGFFLYGLSSIVWLFILKKLPLSIAYPTLSLSYIGVMAISVLVLGESFTLTKALGMGLIFLGVAALFSQS